MSQIPVGNAYNVSGTPIYNYQEQPIYNVPSGQTVNVSQPESNNAQIYKYPEASLYDTSKQAASGVNIFIYNPTGYGATSGQFPLTGTYAQQPSSTQVINNIPQQQPPVVKNNIKNASPIASTPITEQNTPQNTEKNKTKKITELTDNYIKTLENYLKSTDAELRKTGIKELINRYEEDSSRYDDPALTALLNIALQDEDEMNRLLAMSVLSSGSAHGDENTVTLLQNLQKSDKIYGEEAKMANDALLNAIQSKVEVPDDSPEKKEENNNKN